MTTVGSKTYANVIAPRFSLNLKMVFVVTTLVSTALSLLYLILAERWHILGGDDSVTSEGSLASSVWVTFAIAVPIVTIASFFDELAFLPSVVLATNTVRVDGIGGGGVEMTPVGDYEEEEVESSRQSNCHGSGHEQYQHRDCDSNSNIGLEYGTYIACIDFGDQVGAWITVPIVSALGMDRADWSRLPELLLICAGLRVFTLLFLGLIPDKNGGAVH
eukprot:CAMPEP_0172508686 /NCGR_PEP_ID=MMETSP1066-20121228/213858_1 /TAXON_ID=671091 /ORGANISM="Coscinodiscus wailesii, Strain CCMP2513" /LENGTH=217 /DNA_ID=CAMNT_0013286777 /DNA_START=209 /DNA_END=862 /DNA_ORIENTATION=-